MKKMFILITILLFSATAINHTAQPTNRGAEEVTIDEFTHMSGLTAEQIKRLEPKTLTENQVNQLRELSSSQKGLKATAAKNFLKRHNLIKDSKTEDSR